MIEPRPPNMGFAGRSLVTGVCGQVSGWTAVQIPRTAVSVLSTSPGSRKAVNVCGDISGRRVLARILPAWEDCCHSPRRALIAAQWPELGGLSSELIRRQMALSVRLSFPCVTQTFRENPQEVSPMSALITTAVNDSLGKSSETLKKGYDIRLKKGYDIRLKKGYDIRLKKGYDIRLKKGYDVRLKKGYAIRLKKGYAIRLKKGYDVRLKKGYDIRLKKGYAIRPPQRDLCDVLGHMNRK
ncbi:hypothetical protein EGW08_014533 [Elysia chlorotica]|uniref:Uncharacterized protein n=1 Tax=Elysia chlorotica TaxID=188477 RepID=A0A3S0ZFJ6_ELYCH|nr:hypothetical protein EGW08_014533 [Elysia chlorotica]